MRNRLASLTAPLLLGLLAVPGPAGPSARQADPAPAPAADLAAKADELIGDRNYDSAFTDSYEVKTDDPRFDVEAAARLLDRFRSFFDAYWSGRVDLHPHREPGRIYLFYSRYKYRQLLDVAEVTRVQLPVGHYSPSIDIISVHTDTVPPADFPDVLIHEAAHHLVQRELYGPDRMPPPWLAEGLASYFGYMARGRDGTFQPERIGGKGVALIREARAAGPAERVTRYRTYRKVVNRGDAGPISDLTGTTNPASFYAEKREERYASSWLFVHFLLHGEGGVHAGPFAEFLARDIRGETDAYSLYRSLGASAEELQPAFEKYVLKLKVK